MEWHRLGMSELVLGCGAHDVGVSDAHRTLVRGHLDNAPRLHIGPQGPEKEPHQVLVAPIHERVAIEEAANSSSQYLAFK